MVLCVCVMATNFLELAITLKYLGAKWLPGKKGNFTPCVYTVLVYSNELDCRKDCKPFDQVRPENCFGGKNCFAVLSMHLRFLIL